MDPQLLGLGYAIAHSSGTRTSVHYNLQLGGETALMTKERFVERYGVPRYTVGVGGSGGAIQQYVYGQNHPGLLDAAIPVVSYPDMTTQTVHVGDCELLEHYMDVTDAANPKWRNWDDREWLIGLNGNPAFPNPYTGQAGSDECVNGWRGLTPLALNPLFGTAGAGTERMNPAVMASVKWTHWEDARNVYGVRADGWARSPWDNVGVQYGLKALVDGHITPAEFLDLNAKVGSWKEQEDMVQEGQPFLPTGGFDPWSARNMRSGRRRHPRRRRSGDIIAMRNAYAKGLYFDGDIDIPILDVRPYLEEALDMHNSHQSFASRQRMLDETATRQPGDLVLGAGGRRRTDAPERLRGDRRVDGQPGAPPVARRGRQPPGRRRRRVLHGTGDDDRRRRRRVGGHPRPPRARAVHARLPDPLDVADRRRRPAARRRLQVRAAAGREGDRPRALRRLEPERGRARPARADLPDRRVRLHATRRGRP